MSLENRTPDPVMDAAVRNTPWNPDPVRYEDDGWYFYDETWAGKDGPYESEEAARAALADYCAKYL